MAPLATTKPASPKAKSGPRKKKLGVSKYNGVDLPDDATQRRRLRNKLSAQVHRKRKQDALKTAQQECDACDVVIGELKDKLNDTRAKISSLQAVMDAIEARHGAEAVRRIFEKCAEDTQGSTNAFGTEMPIARTVSSDSGSSVSSAPSAAYSDDESL
ncbi:hypothetical protein ACHAWF_012983 [Thalassiosira exigua]